MRRIYLLFVFALAGSAWGQPDTMWTWQFHLDRTYATTHISTLDTIFVGMERTRIFDGSPNVCIEAIVGTNSLENTGGWSRSLGSLAYSTTQIFKRNDESLLVIGWRCPECAPFYYDPYVWKFDSARNLQWERAYDYSRSFVSADMFHRPYDMDESGYYLIGNQIGGTPAALLKIDLEGDSLWTRRLSPWQRTRLRSVKCVGANEFMIAGFGGNEGFQDRAFVMRVDSNGTILHQWDCPIEDTQPISLSRVDNEFVVTGTSVDGNVNHVWYARLDHSCNELFFEEEEANHHVANVVRSASCANGDLILSIWSYGSASTLRRLSPDFSVRWIVPSLPIVVYDLDELTDGSLALSGGAGGRARLLRTQPDVVEQSEAPLELPATIALHPAYPNPFNPNTTITFDLAREMNVTLTAYDILGNQVKTLVNGRMPAGTHDIAFDGAGLPSGIYFCRLEAGTFSQTQKLMLLK